MDGHQEALIDVGAIKDNVSALVKHVGGAQLMAVVKSDGYGHGMIPAAAAALAGGADWLGVVHVGDALALRAAGFTAPELCLLAEPDAPHEDAIRVADALRSIAMSATIPIRVARLHLKIDTGMARGGATEAEWPGVIRAARAAEAAGDARIIGIWSHLACADIPGHPSIGAQLGAFRSAVGQAEAAGARPQLRHLANTPATLTLPDTWFDMVRSGGAVVGLSTLPGGAPDWLRPAMTIRTQLIQVKRVPRSPTVTAT